LSPLPANESADVDEACQVFLANFSHGSTWANSLKLTQIANVLADVYGFTTRSFGYTLICGCGQSHCQKNVNSLYTLGLDHEEEKQRNREPVYYLRCE
jgi:hypothetical protein